MNIAQIVIDKSVPMSVEPVKIDSVIHKKAPKLMIPSINTASVPVYSVMSALVPRSISGAAVIIIKLIKRFMF